jgi:hypothetical protein
MNLIIQPVNKKPSLETFRCTRHFGLEESRFAATQRFRTVCWVMLLYTEPFIFVRQVWRLHFFWRNYADKAESVVHYDADGVC